MLPDGTRFMPDHDPRAELAPRDVVARAIDFEMKKRGLDCVYLDISHKPETFPQGTFPQHLRALPGTGHRHHARPHSRGARRPLHLRRHHDRPARPAPISTICMPSAKSPTPACTAPTGWPAIRCWNAWCSPRPPRQDILEQPESPLPPLPEWDESRVTDADEEIVISHNWDELRRFMWDYVGIVRTNKRLQRAQHRIKLLQEEINEYYQQLPRQQRPARTAQPGADRRPDRAQRHAAPRKPRPAFQPGLSGAVASSGKHGSGARLEIAGKALSRLSSNS